MKLIVNGCVLDLDNTQVMGILNITPDSFFDGGMYNTISKSIDHVNKMIKYGATLIDIGGESTRPGSTRVNEEEELERILPVVYEVIKRFDVFISINTSSVLVMREISTVAGVHLINDIRSLSVEGAMEAVKNSNVAICLMHMKGTPKTMQNSPVYSNVIQEVNDYFGKRIECCKLAGIDETRLLIDPGFGFGKQVSHNYQLLSNLKFFHRFKLPILIGVSRKSMINYDNDPQNRLIGSVTCAAIAAIQGVHIIRAHDIKETMEALHIVKSIRNFNKNKEYLYESSEILRD